MNEFARTLRRLMQQHGFTQRETAERVGVSVQAISDYATSKRNPRGDKLQRIAECFGVTTDELLGRDVTEVEGLDFGTYQRGAQRTASTVDALDKLVNGALGLAGEGGEVADLIKKHLFQGHELDREKLVDELGDVLWYIAELAAGLGVTLDEIARHNIDKLWRRYPAGFDSVRSRERNE